MEIVEEPKETECIKKSNETCLDKSSVNDSLSKKMEFDKQIPLANTKDLYIEKNIETKNNEIRYNNISFTKRFKFYVVQH